MGHLKTDQGNLENREGRKKNMLITAAPHETHPGNNKNKDLATSFHGRSDTPR